MAELWDFEEFMHEWIDKIADNVRHKPKEYAIIGLLYDGGIDLTGIVSGELQKAG